MTFVTTLYLKIYRSFIGHIFCLSFYPEVGMKEIL